VWGREAERVGSRCPALPAAVAVSSNSRRRRKQKERKERKQNQKLKTQVTWLWSDEGGNKLEYAEEMWRSEFFWRNENGRSFRRRIFCWRQIGRESHAAFGNDFVNVGKKGGRWWAAITFSEFNKYIFFWNSNKMKMVFLKFEFRNFVEQD
jgi:hypothetical protein